MTSRTESVARALLRHYVPRERFVYNSRPDWLRYPPTGWNLELDILLPDRNIAIEVDGVQHGRHIPGLQKTFEDLVMQQRRNIYKLEACKHRGIPLYKLTSSDLIQRRFEPFIRSLVAESEWRRATPPLSDRIGQAASKLSCSFRTTGLRPQTPGLRTCSSGAMMQIPNESTPERVVTAARCSPVRPEAASHPPTIMPKGTAKPKSPETAGGCASWVGPGGDGATASLPVAIKSIGSQIIAIAAEHAALGSLG